MEDLAAKVENLTQLANTIEKDKHEAEDKDKKDSMENEEKEKMVAKRARRDAALKKAMEETDDDKKDAAIRKAQEDMDEKKHEAGDDDEAKEHKAHVASIIEDSKRDLQTKILQANLAINPNGIKAVEERIKTASITELKKELAHIEPFIANVQTPQIPQTPTMVIPPYQAKTHTVSDDSVLTAASPDYAFAKIPTKELMGDDL